MDIAILVLGAVVAGFVQGLSGFAFGLVAMSFWAWVLPPSSAAVMAVFGALTGQVIALVGNRRKTNLNLLLPFMVGGLAGIPIGVAFLPHLDSEFFRAMLGSILLLWCPAMFQMRRLPQVKGGGPLADCVVGALGGVMCGFGGFSGTLPTLWCTLKGFSKDDHRSVIQNFNLSMLSVTMAIYASNDLITRDVWPLFAIVGPAILVPSLLGNRFYVGISEIAFRKLVLGMLTLSGIALLSSSLPHILSRTVNSQL